MRDHKKAMFTIQRNDAKKRGIEFLLTFEEWLKAWEDSGHFEERGKRRGQYVMARFGDVGPYAVGNIKIIKTEENVSEGHWKAMSEFHKNKILGSVKGVPKSIEHKRKLSESKKGKLLSEAHKIKMMEGRKAKPLSQEARQKMSRSTSMRNMNKKRLRLGLPLFEKETFI